MQTSSFLSYGGDDRQIEGYVYEALSQAEPPHFSSKSRQPAIQCPFVTMTARQQPFCVTVFNPSRHRQYLIRDAEIEIRSRPDDLIQLEDAEANDLQLRLGWDAASETFAVTRLGACGVAVNGEQLAPSQTKQVSSPAELHVANTLMILCAVPTDDDEVGFASSASELAEGETPEKSDCRIRRLRVLPRLGALSADGTDEEPWPAPSASTLTQWFTTLGSIQRCAAGSEAFYEAAVQAMIYPGGLDSGMFLDRQDGRWHIRCSHVSGVGIQPEFDPEVVEFAAMQRDTVYVPTESMGPDGRSSDAVFASPVFGESGNVIGMLYGMRRLNRQNRRRGIRRLEALWIQLVAEAVTAGGVRLERESATIRQQVLLEQAFPAQVLQQLGGDLQLPTEEREVTVLFADLMESSLIGQRLRPDDMHCLLADVLDAMTRAVNEYQGTIVDFYGDGLIAMWNAPVDQADHAYRACAAALGMLHEQTSLDSDWSPFTGRPLQLGIGIHTCQAIVGNAGSRLRLKYGPRGIGVNLANRIEKVTRQLNTPIVVTRATHDRVQEHFTSNRLGTFRLKGIRQPIDLYSLHDGGRVRAHGAEPMSAYCRVLELVEAGNLVDAVHVLDNLSSVTTDDDSLTFLRQQLDKIACGQEPLVHASPDPLIFDLTAHSTRLT